MDAKSLTRKRRKLIVILAALGFLIALIFWAYLELTDSSPPPPTNYPLLTVLMVLCPPSVLTIPIIDAEPGTIDFTLLWLTVGLLNSGLYAAIGAVIGAIRWKLNAILPEEGGSGHKH